MKKRKPKCEYPIYSSFPKDAVRGKKTMTVKEIYVCIWPANPNIPERIPIEISYEKQQKHFTAHNLQVHIPQQQATVYLLLDKTGEDLEKSERNFLFMRKGSYIVLQSSRYKKNYYVFDNTSGGHKHKYFCGMLNRIVSDDGAPQLLVNYINEHFPNIKTFSFAIYLKVHFRMDKDSYVFDVPVDLPIWSVVVLGEIPREEKPVVHGLQYENVFISPQHKVYLNGMEQLSDECSAEDIGKMYQQLTGYLRDIHKENKSVAKQIIDRFICDLAQIKDEE